MNIPKNGFYYHYKHDPNGPINNYAYEVVGIARNTEDKSFSVLYIPMYETDWFKPADYQSRPMDMFNGEVVKDGQKILRFRLITDPEIILRLEEIKKEMVEKVSIDSR